MKRLLIISPYFPPSNAADMQRIRMSLPYFKEFGWQPEVVTVYPKHSDMVKDPLLLESVPDDVKIHFVDALPTKYTSTIGLGSLALRSLWYYYKTVGRLLKDKHFDLVYFSTTQFPVMILGNYWKKQFGVPYVIDMQDPWHTEYYQDKPKSERPRKYWFSYRLNKYLEPIAMKRVDGLISVSKAYITTLQNRYPRLKNLPVETLTFGAFKKDFELTARQKTLKAAFKKEAGLINLVYIGRGGFDMQAAVRLLFTAFKNGLSANHALFSKLRFHFIGTSYAPKGKGTPSILPVAKELAVAEFVHEQTDRISFYQNIYTLLEADALVIPGSDDPQYTASKIYPYILAEKPLLAIFNPLSSAAEIICNCNAGQVANLTEPEKAVLTIYQSLSDIAGGVNTRTDINQEAFEEFSARNMTRKQCKLFDRVVGSW